MFKHTVKGIILCLVLSVIPIINVSAQEPQPQTVQDIVWQIYEDSDYYFTLEYPENWVAEITLENNWRSEYVIKRRITFNGPENSRIDLDIWEADTVVDLEQWLDLYQQRLALFASESNLLLQPNAIISGLPAVTVITKDDWPMVISLVTDGKRIFRLKYSIDNSGIVEQVFFHIASTFYINQKVRILEGDKDEFSLPENFNLEVTGLAKVATQTCGAITDPQTNVYPCGGDSGDGKYGNCTWWAAYSRDDIGSTSWGNADQWYASALGEGYGVCRTGEAGCTPVVGATAWYALQHVAHTKGVEPITVSEMNYYATSANYPSYNPSVWLNIGTPMNGEPDGYIFGFKPDAPITVFREKGFFDTTTDNVLNNIRFYNSGDYNVSDGINDQISSVSIGENWSIKLYEHADQQGECVFLDSDGFDLSNIGSLHRNFDERISSVEVFYGVCPFLDGCYYPGGESSEVSRLKTSSGFCSGGDSTPPTASWISPSNNSTINSQVVALNANASDFNGIDYVRFSAKYGGSWHNLHYDYSSPYGFNWDLCASNVPDGDIELGLQAYDKAGNEYVYSSNHTNYHITKSYNCNSSTPPPTPSDEVKLYNQDYFGGDPFWTGGEGNHSTIHPLQFTRSIEMPSGWSVKTYGDYNFTGAEHCWSGSEDKLQDHGWTAEAKSLRIYNSNVCPDPTPPSATWEAKFWRTATCYDDHSQCTDSNTTHRTNYNVPGVVNGRNYIIREDWGTNSPGGSTPNDEFTGKFTANINFSPGNYVFYSTNDDGLKFKLPGFGEYQTGRDNREDNQQMCSDGGQSYYLSGNTQIEAYLHEAGGDATIQIWYDNNTDACNPPVLLWPSNGGTVTDNTPTFDWGNKAWNPQYTIAIDGTEYTVSSSDFTPSTALAYGNHIWRIRARNPYGGVDSPWSAEWQFAIAPTPPSAPANLQATDGEYTNKLSLTWDVVPDVSSYEVYRAVSYNGSKSKLTTTSATSFNDSSVTVGDTYYYWIKACSTSVCSNYSDYDTGWRNGLPPSDPSGLSASDGTSTSKIYLDWNAVSDATGYQVWRNTVNSTISARQIATISDPEYDDANVISQQVYYYWVKSQNSYGVSDFSGYNSGYLALPPDEYIDFDGAWLVDTYDVSAPPRYEFSSGDTARMKMEINNQTSSTVDSIWDIWVVKPDGDVDYVESDASFEIQSGVRTLFSEPYIVPDVPGTYIYNSRVRWNGGQSQAQGAIHFYVEESSSEQANIYLPLVLKDFCVPPILFQDSFNNANSGWHLDDLDCCKYEYLNGEYRALIKLPGWYAWPALNTQLFSDYMIEVDGRLATTMSGGYGVSFGISDDWGQWYNFMIDDSYYRIVKYDDGSWINLQSWAYSSAINTGTATNHFKVIYDGSKIEVYINGIYLTTVYDADYLGPRRVGVFVQAWSDGNSNVDARFDNYKVTALTCGINSQKIRTERIIEGDLFISPSGFLDDEFRPNK